MKYSLSESDNWISTFNFMYRLCILNSNICLVWRKLYFLMVPTFEQPSMPLLFELLFVFSDGFLFALVLYLLAAVYLDASPPPPYLGDRPNLFWAGANTATFSLKIFRREELIKILSPDPVYVWAILRTFLKFPQSGLHLSNLTTSHDKRFVTL